MMVAKVGDSVVGICVCAETPYPDVGTIVSGSPMKFEMGIPVARISDSVTFSCGVSTIVSGAMQEFNFAPGVARTGDQVCGCGNGTIVATSNNFSFM